MLPHPKSSRNNSPPTEIGIVSMAGKQRAPASVCGVFFLPVFSKWDIPNVIAVSAAVKRSPAAAPANRYRNRKAAGR